MDNKRVSIQDLKNTVPIITSKYYFKTEDGRDVVQIDKDTFQIVGTDIILQCHACFTQLGV